MGSAADEPVQRPLCNELRAQRVPDLKRVCAARFDAEEEGEKP